MRHFHELYIQSSHPNDEIFLALCCLRNCVPTCLICFPTRKLLFIVCLYIFFFSSFFQDADVKDCRDMVPKLYKHWLDLYKTSGGDDFHSSKQNYFFTLCKCVCLALPPPSLQGKLLAQFKLNT